MLPSPHYFRVKIFIRELLLNAYAFLFDGLLLVLGICMLWGSSFWDARGILLCCLPVEIIFFTAAVHLHREYPTRKRLYYALLRKGNARFSPSHYEEFMDVPCHRMVCLAALWDLGRKGEYAALKKAYYRPCKRIQIQTKITIYQEGANHDTSME